MATPLLLARTAQLALLASLLGGCGASTGAQKPSALAKPIAPKPVAKPAKQRLLEALRAVQRPGPVLEVLPPSIIKVLEARLAALTPEQREQLLSGELGATMPLLHLKAGGSAGVALLALASSPAAAQEVPVAFELAGQVSDEDRLRLVKLAHDLAQRAALHFLRDRVLDLSSAPPGNLGSLLAAIEVAAVAAERQDIVRLSFEAWAAASAPVEVLGALGVACARDEDEACVAQMLEAVPENRPEHARLFTLKQALDSRRDGDPIVKAWSLLRLGRYADARRALAPVEGKARTDLRVAAALAVTLADGVACPGLQPNVGTPKLCADALRARPGLSSALADMDLAWQSRAGRDAASTEAYIGMAHVVPWVTELSLPLDKASLERSFGSRYQALSKVLAELPSEKPLAVFCSALAAGVSLGLHTNEGERPRLDASQKQELWFAALGVEAAAPRLAVSSLLAADQSVAPILPKSVPRSLLAARAGLLAWEAADGPDAAQLEAAKSALAEQLSVAPQGSSEGASALLLLAELDAHAAPSERSHRALAQVSSQLIGQPLPPELALRAVLDAAGALERLGKISEALGVLTKASEIDSLPGPSAELLALIRAEKLVLEWDAKKDPERKALAKALSAIPVDSSARAKAFVIGAWGSSKVLRQGKQSPKQLLAERIGARAAETLARGALLATRVSLRVSYQFHTGVLPEVTFEPMLVPLVRPDLLQKAIQ
jgi:hypothetical protein